MDDSTNQLIDALREVRERTLALVSDLSDEQLMGPRLRIVNPLRWEIAHVAWFQEFWLLRHLRREPPILSQGDKLYDSAKVAHDTRWDIPLLSRPETLEYMEQVLDRVIERNRNQTFAPDPVDGYDETYFLQLALFHEQMHAEAFTYTRQTLGYAAPRLGNDATRTTERPPSVEEPGGDALVPGGTFILGSERGTPFFTFDNEQWSHEVEIEPFSISKTAVSNGEFARFVEDGGYRRRELWSEDGWLWRENANARHPVYWKADGNGRWARRYFDQWVSLEGAAAVIHVNWYEADAYCRWAGRRLPSEAEWEAAASGEPASDGAALARRKRKYAWGDEPPTPGCANLDSLAMGCIDVNALSAGDSAFGCRQMIGNSWEWCADWFGPYPGFAPGPYKEYSAPWFGDHKVLRGGCWVTRSRMIRSAYRNFYTPDRRDVWAGFRTCAK